jgi:two-component sensor histidine kinase
MAMKLALVKPNLSNCYIEQAPVPMATVEGPAYSLGYVNPAFCRLVNKSEEEVIGKSFREILDGRVECLALLDRVYRSGKSESFTEQDHASVRPVWSYTMWPIVANEPIVGIMIQVIETAPLYEKTLAMNEALVIGSLRQHELNAVANSWNARLQTEAGGHKQRELDAQMLTREISHRIKNNLQIIINLIGYEAKQAAAPYLQGYEAMQSRIGAIAELYDLVSQSSHGQAVALDVYLGEIAKVMSASLLGAVSSIAIEVKAETVDIDPDRAVPFGLLVNELVTNAIKHAFPDGKGSVVLSVRRIGDQIELDVADNGVGMKDTHSAKTSKHGADYVRIFVRQLNGTFVPQESEGRGTIVRVRFPFLAGERTFDRGHARIAVPSSGGPLSFLTE